MTEVALRELAEALRTANLEWVLIDRAGRVVDGARPPGEDVTRWIPGWSATAVGLVRQASDGRWLRLESLGSSSDLTLHLVLDRTSDVVIDEVRILSSRRDAQADLAGATAREMNDAMTIVQGRLELLRAFALSDPEAAERHTAIAMEHAQRAAQTLHDLRLVGAVTPSDIEPVPLLAVIQEAVCTLLGAPVEDLSGGSTSTERVQLDVPADLAILGQYAPVVRVLVSILRAVGAARDAVTIRARREADRVRVVLDGGARRRADLDTPPLGIVTALVDALGGTLSHSGTGVVLDLSAADPDAPSEPALTEEGELLVVGTAHLADRVRQLLAPDPLTIRAVPTAEAALSIFERARGARPIGLVSRLLLPEQSGLWLTRMLASRGVELTLGPLILTPDQVRTPSDVRCLKGPLTRARLIRGLRSSAYDL